MPLLTSITPAGRKYAQVNSSSRVQTIFTGCPAARDKRAASSAASLVCFPPYAEPVSGTIARTLLSGIWNTAARSSRTAKGRCVPVQTVRGAREAFLDGAFLMAMTIVRTAGGLFLEIGEEFFVRDLRDFFPLCANSGNGVLCFALSGRGCANEIAIADDHHACHC